LLFFPCLFTPFQIVTFYQIVDKKGNKARKKENKKTPAKAD